MSLVTLNINDKCDDNDIMEWWSGNGNDNEFQLMRDEDILQELLKEDDEKNEE